MKRQQLLRAAFVFLALVLLALPSLAFRMIQNNTIGRVTAGPAVPCNAAGGFAHWNERDLIWFRNIQNQMADQDVQNAIFWGSFGWTINSDYALFHSGNITNGFATDNMNTTLFGTNGACTGGCLALTALVLEAGQVIVESDIVFRSDLAWDTGGGDFDVQAVAAHEFGHSLGIHHTEVPGPADTTMGAGYFGTDGRSLHSDDIAAMQCSQDRYPLVSQAPCTAPPPTPAFISGPGINHCSGLVAQYSTQANPDAIFRWEVVNTGFTETTTDNNVMIVLTLGTYTIRVRAENDCGASSWRTGSFPVVSCGWNYF